MVFHGFGRTEPLTGMRAYRAFKFGALTPAACAATVEHPDQIQAGRIEVTCEAVVKTGQGTGKHRDAGWAADAASKKLPEGKKWFLQPGLQAEEGSTVKQTNRGWDCALYSVLYPLPVLRLRCDTADNLRLRKNLNPSNPQHAAILARASSTGVAGSSSASRQLKQEHRAAGVKRERSSPGQQQQRQAAGAGGAGLPRSATAETINLVDDAPAPLLVCGRVLAAGELAVCDLAGSDDEGEPAWQVQKKQAIELAV
ncbi:hypothetical protein COO60DRAFT_375379 [Scenedesmus sp. NREL 46B-D3]|nr:hypothetical protein COO60DRAFT_375379 [Scenedesmus sp. NREL 46B-D3]